MTVSLAKDNMKKLEILRFTASWCGPCKQLEANLERANLGIDIKVMDIDEQEDVARQYNVRSVPTLVLLKNGEEFKRSVGSKTVNQLKDWVE